MSTNKKEAVFEFIKKGGKKVAELYESGKQKWKERREEAQRKAREKAAEEALEIISYIPGLERTIKEFQPLVEKLKKLKDKVDPTDTDTLNKVDKAISDLEDTIEKLEEEKRAEYVKEFIDQFQITPDASFELLNELQKFKVIQDLKKRVVDMVKIDAETQYSEYVKKTAGGQIGVVIRKAFAKNLDMQGAEKEALESLSTDPDKKKLVMQDMTLLTKKVTDLGPDGITINKERNRVDIVYLKTADLSNPEIVKEYNEAANDFIQIPYEWGLDSDPVKKEKYLRAKDLYEIAREKVQLQATLDTKTRLVLGDKDEVPDAEKLRIMIGVNNLEKNILLDQMLNTHPEADQELEGLGEDPNIKEWVKRFWQDKTTGKGLTNTAITGAGFGARTAVKGAAVLTASSGLTLVAAPVIGAVIGRWRARVRARAEIEKSQKQARLGQGDARTSKEIAKAEEKLLKAQKNKNPEAIKKAKAELELVKKGELNMNQASDLSNRLRLLTDKLEKLRYYPDTAFADAVDVDKFVMLEDQNNPGKFKKYAVTKVDPASGKISLVEVKSVKTQTINPPADYANQATSQGKSEWLIAEDPDFAGRQPYGSNDPKAITLDDLRKYENRKDLVYEKANPRAPALKMSKAEMLKRMEKELLEQIGRRIEYTEKKILEGMVSFGESGREAKAIADAKTKYNIDLDALTMAQRKYDLVNALNNAVLNVASLEGQDKNAIDDRLRNYLEKKKSNIDTAQKEYIVKQGKRGAMMGAGFATFGYAARWVGEELGWWGGNESEEDNGELGESNKGVDQNQMQGQESYSSRTTVPEPENVSAVPEPIDVYATEGNDPIRENSSANPENGVVKINQSPNSTQTESGAPKTNSTDTYRGKAQLTNNEIEPEDMDPKFIVDKGLGVTHAFKEQIKADPGLGKALAKQINYTGKIGTPAFYEALGKHFGYINEGGNQTDNIDEIRVKWGGDKGMAAYKFMLDNDGKTYKVREYHLTDGKWQPIETHRMDEDFEGEAYERKYEYYKQHKGDTGGGERIRKPIPTNEEGGSGPTKLAQEGGPTLQKREEENIQFKIKEEVKDETEEPVEETEGSGPTKRVVRVNKPKTGLTSGGYMTKGAYYTDGAQSGGPSGIFRVREDFTPAQKADIAREMDGLSGARRDLMERMTRDVVRDMGPDKGTLTFYHNIALTGERAMNSDLNQIVNGDGSYMKSDFWRNVEGVNAKKFLTGKEGGTSADDIQLREYIQNLIKFSRLEPKNNLFKHEDVGEFIRRAHSHLAVLAYEGKFDYNRLHVPTEPYVPNIPDNDEGYQETANEGGGYSTTIEQSMDKVKNANDRLLGNASINRMRENADATTLVDAEVGKLQGDARLVAIYADKLAKYAEQNRGLEPNAGEKFGAWENRILEHAIKHNNLKDVTLTNKDMERAEDNLNNPHFGEPKTRPGKSGEGLNNPHFGEPKPKTDEVKPTSDLNNPHFGTKKAPQEVPDSQKGLDNPHFGEQKQ